MPSATRESPRKSTFDFIKFRNANSDGDVTISVGVVTIQCFMILAAALVIAGLFYVGTVMIMIIFHHLLWDREPKNVPTYVKRALQFDSSDTDSEEDGHEGGENGPRSHREDNIIEIVDDTGNYDEQSDFTSHKARKMANLEKFLNKDIDVNR